MSASLPAVSTPLIPGAFALPGVMAGGQLGGFEALLAALFGTPGTPATPVASAATPSEAEGEGAPAADGAAQAQSLVAALFAAPVATPAATDAPAVSDTGASAQPPPPPAAATVATVPQAGAAAVPTEATARASATSKPAASLDAPDVPPQTPPPAAVVAALTPTQAAGTARAVPPQVLTPTTTATASPEPTADAVEASQPAQLAAVEAQPAPQPASAPEPRPARPAASRRAGAEACQSPVAPTISTPTLPVSSGALPTAAAHTAQTGAATLLAAQTATGEIAGPPSPDASAQKPAADPQAPAPAAGEPVPMQSLPAHATAPAAVRGGPETVATLAAQILKKLDSRTTRFDMELDPAGLGRVDVRLEVNAHGRVTATMAFDNPQAAAELRGRANELTRALEQAGFDVSGGLSFDVAGDSGQPGQNRTQDQSNPPAWRGRAFQAALDGAADADLAAGALQLRRPLLSGVDIKI